LRSVRTDPKILRVPSAAWVGDGGCLEEPKPWAQAGPSADGLLGAIFLYRVPPPNGLLGYLHDGHGLATRHGLRRSGRTKEGRSSNGVRPFEGQKVSFRGANDFVGRAGKANVLSLVTLCSNHPLTPSLQRRGTSLTPLLSEEGEGGW